MQFSPDSSTFFLLKSKYSPLHPVLNILVYVCPSLNVRDCHVRTKQEAKLWFFYIIIVTFLADGRQKILNWMVAITPQNLHVICS
jgi:hypothetical protein